MANVLTSLAADIYRAADVVGREAVGISPSATLNTDSTRVALNDVVRSFFTRAATVTTITPSMTIPEGTDQTVDNKTLTINTTAAVQIPWTGEDIKHVENGSGFETIYGDQITQAMRAIANQIETDAWNAVRKGASRAYGTAGTTPFASNFNEVANLRKILVDNGCPMDNQVTLVLNTTASTNLRNLAQLNQVNTSGDTTLLRQGELLNLQGIRIKESNAIGAVTIGTGSGYAVNGAVAAGVDTIPVNTGTGTILAGDVLSNTQSGRDSNKYVVGTALTGGNVILNDPGTRVAWVSADTVAVGAAFTANVAFHKTALEIAMRPMAEPTGGDAAVDTMIVQDPWSGLVFEVRAYKGFMKAMFMVSCVYGIQAWKPQNIALLLG